MEGFNNWAVGAILSRWLVIIGWRGERRHLGRKLR
jgi:hypothetical protein